MAIYIYTSLLASEDRAPSECGIPSVRYTDNMKIYTQICICTCTFLC